MFFLSILGGFVGGVDCCWVLGLHLIVAFGFIVFCIAF